MGKAYFLSDLHLGAPYFSDSKEAERRVVSFLDHIAKDADEIYLLGDILDYWYEYRYVVPRGFVRFFGKLAELSDSGVRIVWFIGNHDIWIFDYLPSELGIEVVDGERVENVKGKRFYMTHGDGIGKLKPSFRFLRRLFRSKICQKLFSGIHPRWTVPFAYNWSSHSRKYDGPSEEDAERMLVNVRDNSREIKMRDTSIDYFVYGHLHLLLEERFQISKDGIGYPAEIIVLGEWIKTFSYGVFDGQRFRLSRWINESEEEIKLG